MDRETVKNYLAMYDETYSYNQISNKTGYSVEELRELYDEIFEAKEIMARRKNMRIMVRMGGVIEINPVTFVSHKYETLSELKGKGFNVSNVFYACRHPASLCNGSLWRFGIDIDERNVEKSLKRESPELFIPVWCKDMKTGSGMAFKTLQIAHSEGYNKKCIMQVIEGKKKSYKGCKWFRGVPNWQEDLLEQ